MFGGISYEDQKTIFNHKEGACNNSVNVSLWEFKGDAMKIISIVWGLLLALGLCFVTDCFGARGGKRPRTLSASSGEKVDVAVDAQVWEMDVFEPEAPEEDSEFDSEEDYIKTLSVEVQEKINRADRLFAIGRKDEAIKLFEEIADREKIGFAFERLGDAYLSMVDKEQFNAVIAQKYFKMALENGLAQVIEKIMKVDDLLCEFAEANRRPEMSDAAMSMYS